MNEQAIAIINQRIQDLKDCVMSDYIRKGIIENLYCVIDMRFWNMASISIFAIYNLGETND
jgi:hypothetical protein